MKDTELFLHISVSFFPVLGLLCILRYSIQGAGFTNLAMLSGVHRFDVLYFVCARHEPRFARFRNPHEYDAESAGRHPCGVCGDLRAVGADVFRDPDFDARGNHLFWLGNLSFQRILQVLIPHGKRCPRRGTEILRAVLPHENG